MALRFGLIERYRAMVDLGAGCGLRQGEIFGLAVEDIDADGGWIHVRRQVKRVRCRLVYGLPKNDKERDVPLPTSVARALKAHMEKFEPVPVTLPWETPKAAERRTLPLVFTSSRPQPKAQSETYAKHWAINRNSFDPKHWHRTLRRAGLPVIRANGMHALRHFYASVLLDAGENIKAVSEYLGHHSAGYTLRVYAHLMPGKENRTRRAIDDLFGGDGPDGLATA
ncbi:MAG TPA: site-specific integrase [Candidatus Limnocylindrales bacterium]|nr:site-specific integrase [Candidatus Limnocylindrales bacterium]